MGGATSKFEETDWIRADGKLQRPEDTIDGAEPTSSYGVYFLTKSKLNQREFEVTDLEKNLLYTTKCVPGTLCWFDVYGRELGEILLRVQVDLSRRYWIVYRIGIPSFEGQLADLEATEKLANERRLSGCDLTATPFLFRKCCITVSWSRYMAVALHYGPPDEEHHPVRLRSSSQNSVSLSPERMSVNPTATTATTTTDESAEKRVADRETEATSRPEECVNNENGRNNNDQCDNPMNKSNDNVKSTKLLPPPPPPPPANNNRPHDSVFEYHKKKNSYHCYDATNHTLQASTSTLSKDSSMDSCQQEQHQYTSCRSNNKGRRLTSWVIKQTKAIQDSKKMKNNKFKSDQREGIIHLEKPILLCQEIYDKFIGNHQTCNLSKGKAIELLRQDLEQHMKDGGVDGDDAFLADQAAIFAQLHQTRDDKPLPCQESTAVVQREQQQQPPEAISRDPNEEMEQSKENDTTQKSRDLTSDFDCSGPVHSQQQMNRETINRSDQDGSFCANGGGQNDACANGQGVDTDLEAEEESLIGYWQWQNTWKTHQMKMHVAKGSDLALHCVMAIIFNQVRYERNAIAMTV